MVQGGLNGAVISRAAKKRGIQTHLAAFAVLRVTKDDAHFHTGRDVVCGVSAVSLVARYQCVC